VETVVHGPLPDMAALHGLLARLEEFGAEVVEMRRLHDPGPAKEAKVSATAERRHRPAG